MTAIATATTLESTVAAGLDTADHHDLQMAFLNGYHEFLRTGTALVIAANSWMARGGDPALAQPMVEMVFAVRPSVERAVAVLPTTDLRTPEAARTLENMARSIRDLSGAIATFERDRVPLH